MLRMRNFSSVLAAAALVSLVGVNAAKAAITITYTDFALTSASTTSGQGILKGNGSGPTASTGWHGVLISAVADAASGKVAGFDLNTAANGIFSFSNQGFFAQQWAINQNTGLTVPNSSIQAAVPAPGNTTVKDSFFDSFTGLGFSPAVGLIEDNNLANGPNGPYSQNPIPDTAVLLNGDGDPIADGNNYGVGTFLKGAGAFTTNNATGGQTLPLAFVIVPNGTYVVVTGVFTDSNNAATTIIGSTNAPEPASLGVLGLGAAALLGRRRRKA